MTAVAAAIGACLALALCLARLFAGPTLYDRALAANGVAMKLAVICAAGAILARQTLFIDVAIAFVLATLVVNVAILKFFRTQTFQAPLARTGD